MINQESLDAVAGARIGEEFVRPLYADYNFAQIPQTLRRCLGVSTRAGVPFGQRDDLYQTYDAVVLLLVDARTGVTTADRDILARLPERLQRITVHNKISLPSRRLTLSRSPYLK